MSQNKEEQISDLDLFEECQEIYDFNIEALIIHVYVLSLKSNKNSIKSKIARDLKENTCLYKYRTFFLKVMDSFKSDIERYKKISKFDIRGVHSSLLFMNENIDTIKELNNLERLRLEKELVKIMFYTEKILNEVINND